LPVPSLFLKVTKAYIPPKKVKEGSLFSSITNKMQRYTIRLFLQNALHVSGGSSAYHQELKLYIQDWVFVKLLLLPFAMVEELFQRKVAVAA
jgi:hypothetical protein